MKRRSRRAALDPAIRAGIGATATSLAILLLVFLVRTGL